MTPAHEILQQLGGNKFVVMTGAKCSSDNDGNTLVVKFKGSKVANIMYVTLNGLDLYDVRISKYRGMNIKDVVSESNIYNDMLVSLFEQTTGLKTKLF